jgi:hypothetical protein
MAAGVSLIASLCLAAQAERLPAGAVDFGAFTPSADGEFVEVQIRSNLISMVAKLAEKQEPQVAEMLRNIQLVRVNVIGLDDKNRSEVQARIKEVRAKLDKDGWERIVTAQKKDEDVGVYVKTRGNEAVEGVVVSVLSGTREAVLVNVIGNLKPEQIAELGERFDIDPLKRAGEAIKKP